jgi:hypothetical protein
MHPIDQGTDSLTHDRVRDHSPATVNEAIDRDLRHRVEHVGRAGGVALGRRLAELDREWDIDRSLLALFPVLSGVSAFLGIRGLFKRRAFNGWLGLLGVQMSFMMLHAVVGWCPPVSVLRRLGYRTQREIDRERHALLASSMASPASVVPAH